MRLKLHKLQAKDKQARKTKAEHSKNWDNIDGMLHYQDLSYVPEIIQTKFISRHHNDALAGHFGFEKTRKLVTIKYY